MQNKLLCVLVTCFLMVQGKIQNLCRPGNDIECKRYDDDVDMCCAHIMYKFRGEYENFHACTSRKAIEDSNGKYHDKQLDI